MSQPSVSRGAPVTLDASQRQSVDAAIRETCAIREWYLQALNVRTNHVHAVVTIGMIKPERALTAFKANATKQMRCDGYWRHDYSPWAEKGSKRRLWNSAASHAQLIMCSMGKAMSCPTLTMTEASGGYPVATAPGTDPISQGPMLLRWVLIALVF